MGVSARTRAAMAVGLAGLLASCGPNGIVQNPLAGLQSPFSGPGAGAVDPDLRGRIGGALDTSGAAGGRSGGAVAGPGGAAVPGAVVDPYAGQGVAQPQIEAPGGTRPAAPTAPTSSAPGTAASGAAAATTHKVVAGETAWSISRRYGVTVEALAKANGLPEAMTVRTGQTLTIPAGGGARAAEPVTRPGSGTPTPEPPSAAKPLPREETAPARTPVAAPSAPDLGATRTAASGNGTFRMPVAGSIVRTYAKGSNEGIDISAAPGSQVKAAGSGMVAAITRDTQGAPIVVIRHAGTLMTVYTGLSSLSVAKGDQIGAGQTIGTAGTGGTVHFEVRQGFESVDPEDYLG